jgi:hypothetical protein
MMSQLKSNSTLLTHRKRIKVKALTSFGSALYREIFLFLYSKKKMLKLAKFIATIRGLGKLALGLFKEKWKKPFVPGLQNIPSSLLSNITPGIEKIEQMIKDFKKRLGFGEYPVQIVSFFPFPLPGAFENSWDQGLLKRTFQRINGLNL